MSTPIEKDISEKNQWHIGKMRVMELRYFVKQYDVWRTALTDLNLYSAAISGNTKVQTSKDNGPTDRIAISMEYYESRINLVNHAAASVDPLITKPILMCVMHDIPYNKLITRFDIPYGRNQFYEKVRQFLWCLDKLRQ